MDALPKLFQHLVACVQTEESNVKIRSAYEPQVSSLPATNIQNPISRSDRGKHCLGPTIGFVDRPRDDKRRSIKESLYAQQVCVQVELRGPRNLCLREVARFFAITPEKPSGGFLAPFQPPESAIGCQPLSCFVPADGELSQTWRTHPRRPSHSANRAVRSLLFA